MIWQAVWAGFEYFQREAGYTCTGSHNTRVHGRETGQWHEADLAVAHWLQHTSRGKHSAHSRAVMGSAGSGCGYGENACAGGRQGLPVMRSHKTVKALRPCLRAVSM